MLAGECDCSWVEGAVLEMTYGKDVCDAEDADDDARGND